MEQHFSLSSSFPLAYLLCAFFLVELMCAGVLHVLRVVVRKHQETLNSNYNIPSFSSSSEANAGAADGDVDDPISKFITQALSYSGASSNENASANAASILSVLNKLGKAASVWEGVSALLDQIMAFTAATVLIAAVRASVTTAAGS